MNNILIIEDDKDISRLLEIAMKDLDGSTTVAHNGLLGLDLAQEADYDLILLDVKLPGMNGVELCRELRKSKQTPVIMVTANSEEIDKVLGLEIGADDYITKPFSMRELKARAKAVLRRAQQSAPDARFRESVIKAKELEIDMNKRRVTLDGSNVELSPKEYELICLLAQNVGRSYSRAELLDTIWGYNFEGYEHTVNSHINRLRSKIEPDMANPKFVLTTWGVGYRFNEDL